MDSRKLVIDGQPTIYTIYRDGRLYSDKMGKFMKPYHWKSKGNAEYYVYSVSINRKPSKISMHRAIAIAFIPNPDNKPEVNHIDGNGLNNEISNLEWVTSSENSRHAFKAGLRKLNRTFIKLSDDILDNIRNSTLTQREIANMYDINQGYVSKIRSGQRGTIKNNNEV